MRYTIMEILILIGALFVIFCVASVVIYELIDTPATCDKYDNVKFRYVSNGGLFGGTHKVITMGEQYDGYMKTCIKGKTIFGDDWELEK